MAINKQTPSINLTKEEIQKIFRLEQLREQFEKREKFSEEQVRKQAEILDEMKRYSKLQQEFVHIYDKTEDAKKFREEKEYRRRLTGPDSQSNFKAYVGMNFDKVVKNFKSSLEVNAMTGASLTTKALRGLGLFGKFDVSGLLRKFDEYKTFATQRSEEKRQVELIGKIEKLFTEGQRDKEQIVQFLKLSSVSDEKISNILFQLQRKYEKTVEEKLITAAKTGEAGEAIPELRKKGFLQGGKTKEDLIMGKTAYEESLNELEPKEEIKPKSSIITTPEEFSFSSKKDLLSKKVEEEVAKERTQLVVKKEIENINKNLENQLEYQKEKDRFDAAKFKSKEDEKKSGDIGNILDTFLGTFLAKKIPELLTTLLSSGFITTLGTAIAGVLSVGSVLTGVSAMVASILPDSLKVSLGLMSQERINMQNKQNVERNELMEKMGFNKWVKQLNDVQEASDKGELIDWKKKEEAEKHIAEYQKARAALEQKQIKEEKELIAKEKQTPKIETKKAEDTGKKIEEHAKKTAEATTAQQRAMTERAKDIQAKKEQGLAGNETTNNNIVVQSINESPHAQIKSDERRDISKGN